MILNEKNFIRSCLAGAMIGIGGVAYLAVDNKYVGAFLFSIGLYCVLQFDFNLYTGKCGRIHNFRTLGIGLVYLFGNMIGAIDIALILNTSPELTAKASAIMDAKMSHPLIQTFGLACMCGIMMMIAVDLYNHPKNEAKNPLLTIMPIMVFILSGYEHSVANFFYWLMAYERTITINDLWFLLVCVLGNTIGSLLFVIFKKVGSETRRGYDI